MSFAAEVLASERVKRDLGIGVILGLGAGLSAVHAYHLFASGEGFVSLLVGAIIPLSLSVLLILAGLWFPWSGYGALLFRIGGWCLVGSALLFGISYLTIQYQRAEGVRLANVLFVLAANATGGAIVGLLIGVYDVDRKRTERRLTEERENARRLSRRLTVLNRVLRHDIRNDVNVIDGNARLIIEGTSSPETPAKTIREKASKLHRMSESARKIESLLGRDEVPTEPLDAATLLRTKVLSLERDRPYVDTEVEAPECAWASANPMIESAVENVLENAVAHNDAETPRLEASVSREGAFVELRIADNGPGLPEDEIDVLEKGHETELEHASGLGLWLVNWIVTESGGDVAFEENDPRGSVVTLRLPATEPPADARSSRS